MELIALAGIALGAAAPFHQPKIGFLLITTLMLGCAVLVASFLRADDARGELFWLGVTIATHQGAFIASAAWRLHRRGHRF